MADSASRARRRSRQRLHTAISADGRFLLAASYAFNHVTVSAIGRTSRAAPHQQLDGLQAAHWSPCSPPMARASRRCWSPASRTVSAALCSVGKGGCAPIRGDLQTASGAGPRHLALHPSNGDLYCLNELDCTINRYRRSTNGGITLCQSLEMLPAGYQGSTGARICT